MRIVRAEVMGMCFGVRDALRAIESVERPGEVTIHGELVHNPVVLDDLAERGFAMTSETDRDRVPDSPVVLITAHGVSDRERARLEAAGKRLIDTTCPLVVRVHEEAQKLAAAGWFVVIAGKRGHVEVQGVVEDLDHCEVVEKPEDVRAYPRARIALVCQSTATERQFASVREALATRNPHAELRFVDTACRPTKDHQAALERLLGEVDALVVVGGRNSNNTRALVVRAREAGLPAQHVEDVSDLDFDRLDGFETIGLTAGTSTLDSTIDAVHEALLAYAARNRRLHPTEAG